MGKTEKTTFDITPQEAYALVIAALDVVGGVSPGVHARCRRDMAKRGYSAYPGIRPGDLVKLVDVLNALRPGMADRVIAVEEGQRQEWRKRQREAYSSGQSKDGA